SAVSGHPLHCLQSLVIPYTVCSLWLFPALSAVSGHLYCVPVFLFLALHLLIYTGIFPVLCPQSLVISCNMSAISGHLLYCVRSL
ncbi:unnamed protein product, partial [Staurois parvus]